MKSYTPTYATVEVPTSTGARFIVDADLSDTISIVHGIKLNEHWFSSEDVLHVDFLEMLEAIIDAMPWNKQEAA